MTETILMRIVQDLFIISFLLGLPTAVLLVLWAYSKLSEMDSELRKGKDSAIRLDNFAIRSGVHGRIARWYLDSKARQLNGLKEVDELGDVAYLFGEAKQKFIQQHLLESK